MDNLRKKECRQLKDELSEDEYERNIKGTMWLLRKNNQNLSETERQQLRNVFSYSPALKLAYTLREELTAIFELHLTKDQALERLAKWQAKVRRSGLTCFGQGPHYSGLGFNSQVQRAVGRIPEKVNGNQDTFWDDD